MVVRSSPTGRPQVCAAEILLGVEQKRAVLVLAALIDRLPHESVSACLMDALVIP